MEKVSLKQIAHIAKLADPSKGRNDKKIKQYIIKDVFGGRKAECVNDVGARWLNPYRKGLIKLDHSFCFRAKGYRYLITQPYGYVQQQEITDTPLEGWELMLMSKELSWHSNGYSTLFIFRQPMRGN